MIPKLIRSYKTADNIEVSLFNNGVITTTFKLTHIDYENASISNVEANLEEFLQNLPSGVRVKFRSSTQRVFESTDEITLRNNAIWELGKSKHSLCVSFEKNAPVFKKQLKRLFKSWFKSDYLNDFFENFVSEINLGALEAVGFKPEPIPCNIRFQDSEIIQIDNALRIDNNYASVIKLHKLGNYESTIRDLCFLREILPDPYELVFSVKRIDEKESQLKLNNISKREESGQDLKSHKKYLQAQGAIEEMDLQGKKVFEIEFTILLWFANSLNIHQETFSAKNELKRIGDFGIENMGIFKAFSSTLPGGKPHISNIEMTDRVPSFFPILINGRESLGELSKRSFLFHRSDDSVDEIDIYNASQQNFSSIVIGETGRGKSVFVNNMLQSLLNDEDLKMILVDVKGSYTNTVKRLNGSHHKISTSQNSAMSPFNFLRSDTSMDVIEILSDFLEKLILENGEIYISNQEQANLEECIVKYAKMKPKNPSIDDFVNKIEGIPRVDSLKRWIKGGVYEKVFSSYDEISQNERLHYFDFTNIVTAQKGGVGPAILSAIMAHFNYTLISKETHERLVFVADETPFFVKSCFSSFALLMKNVRKLNGSVILIAQNLSDLIVNKDTSLINQVNTRIFFSREKGFEQFDETSGLSERSISYLDKLKTFNGHYAQFIIKDNGGGERAGKLRLSRKEYFLSTTHANDREKIEGICKIFGLKNENKAIEILADIGVRHELPV